MGTRSPADFVGLGSAEPLPTTEKQSIEQSETTPTPEFVRQDSLIVPEALRTNDHVQIRHFEAKPEDLFKLDVDVNFWKHVIKILITNHHITTDHKDLSDILMYCGDVDIKAEQQHIKTRSAKNKRLCGNVDIDEVIEITQKVFVNGVNILKRLPDFIQFLSELGVNV
jgi:hypothetical protein